MTALLTFAGYSALLAVLAFLVVAITTATLDIIDMWENHPYEENNNVE